MKETWALQSWEATTHCFPFLGRWRNKKERATLHVCTGMKKYPQQSSPVKYPPPPRDPVKTPHTKAFPWRPIRITETHIHTHIRKQYACVVSQSSHPRVPPVCLASVECFSAREFLDTALIPCFTRRALEVQYDLQNAPENVLPPTTADVHTLALRLTLTIVASELILEQSRPEEPRIVTSLDWGARVACRTCSWTEGQTYHTRRYVCT